MNAIPGPILRIGDLRVDPALDEICRDGKIIKVEPRTMRLLVCLAEHPGQVISVEQLLDEVWKDVVVSPDSVYQAIATLRRLLGDDPKEPVYIANVLRRGYRLVAPVAAWTDELAATAAPAEAPVAPLAPLAPVEAPVVPPATAGQPAAGGSGTTRRRSGLALAVLVIAIMAAFAGLVVWRAKPIAGQNAGATGASSALVDKSVAVMPFLDLSEKKDQEYFADGLSEELIDLLTKVPGLHVPARTSSFYFKGKQASPAEIGKALGVGNLLEGSVRKAGDTVRVTAQLVRTDDGLQIWSQTYDQKMTNLFEIQDQISNSVVQALKISLLQTSPQRAAPTANAEAHTLYLQALSLERRAGSEDYAAAMDNLKRAVALDPHFAAAWAAMAEIIVDDFGWHDASEMLDPCGHARKAVDEAIRLDSGLSESHYAKGKVLRFCDHDSPGAEVEFKRALEIDPGNSRAWGTYSGFARETGRSQLAIRLAQEAIIRDPLNAWSYFALAWAQADAGEFTDAEATYRKAVEVDPKASGLHALHANSLLSLRKPAEALAEAQREPDEQFRLMTAPFALDALGQTAEADREIAQFIEKYSGRDPLTVAEFYACRKDADRALKWQKYAPTMDEDLPNRFGCFKNIASDPRFKALPPKPERPE